MNRYKAHIAQNEQLAAVSDQLAIEFTDKKKWDLALNNYHAAVGHMVSNALVEWRLGKDNPTTYFERAIRFLFPALELLRDYPDEIQTHVRLDSINYYLDLAYAHLVMGRSLPEPLRWAVALPEDERSNPDRLKARCVQLMDSHFFELADTGEVAKGWSSFEPWLAKKRGFKLYRETFAAYTCVLEAARAGDKDAAQQAVVDAEKLYPQRAKGPDAGSHWGAIEKFNDDIVDIRLACVIRKAETIGGEGLGLLESIHRWRWA